MKKIDLNLLPILKKKIQKNHKKKLKITQIFGLFSEKNGWKSWESDSLNEYTFLDLPIWIRISSNLKLVIQFTICKFKVFLNSVSLNIIGIEKDIWVLNKKRFSRNFFEESNWKEGETWLIYVDFEF